MNFLAQCRFDYPFFLDSHFLDLLTLFDLGVDQVCGPLPGLLELAGQAVELELVQVDGGQVGLLLLQLP